MLLHGHLPAVADSKVQEREHLSQHNQQQNQNGRYGQPHNTGEVAEGEGERREDAAGATVESTAPAPQPAPVEDEQPVV